MLPRQKKKVQKYKRLFLLYIQKCIFEVATYVFLDIQCIDILLSFLQIC